VRQGETHPKERTPRPKPPLKNAPAAPPPAAAEALPPPPPVEAIEIVAPADEGKKAWEFNGRIGGASE
jgi:hypothetical protein